ncbi:MAG: short-chain dehydrogenase [Planctomycetes bacterium SCN 63-9]|nr:MAG: short-chain dehydrogenase [Planctomycetes bacterium SCN 63-9]
MEGKTCVVTGGTSGIGRIAAEALARRGARVILVGRSDERGAAAIRGIWEATGSRNLDFLRADLSSQADVRKLANQIIDGVPRLDVLINNAGSIFVTRQESADGIEMTWALNHLSYFLLTDLLLPLLKSNESARIVNVASSAHKGAVLDFDDIQAAKGRYRLFRQYQRSKLANILFTYELARRLEGTRVTANTLHPGFVKTNIVNQEGFFGMIFRLGAQLAAITPEEGAKTTIHLASSPEVADISGRYFYKERPSTSSPESQDAKTAERLWRLSEEMTGIAG